MVDHHFANASQGAIGLMPNQSLSDTEIKQYIEYSRWIDAQPAGAAN
jgi:hypothetical protein